MTLQKFNFKWYRQNGTLYNHAWDRMIERGISVEAIKEAVVKGLKHVRKDGKINSFFGGIKVIYKTVQYPEYKKFELITAYFT
ncbi:MAG TPA: hypothetical protein VKM55_08390 [Candidatus Lokiarchaeia archaeon]|nr:hypothetical protein [Candidatus Lokiarchaeia archaeon]